MSRTIQPPSKYMDDVTVTTQGLPIYIGHAGNGFSFHNSWNEPSGALAGTLLFEASNDPALNSLLNLTVAEKAAASDAARWVDVTAVVNPTDPTTGVGNAMEVVNNARFWWFRVKLTVSGGAGNFSSYIATHGDG